MAFENLPLSKPVPRREKKPEVFCVGWRAFVNWASNAPVPLTDATGKPLANDLTDGQQVEIVSWRPRSREGLMYQVRRVLDGSEWWIEARYLRKQAVAERSARPVTLSS
jgi:hypothetical protein